MAVVIVGIMALGTLAGVIADARGGNDSGRDVNSVESTVTPGAEIARLQTQVAADPSDVDSLVVLADTLANNGRAAESIPLFDSAVRSRPDDGNLRLAFGRTLLRMGSLYDAELQLRKAVELSPDDPVAAYYLAATLQAGGEHLDEAREWYQKAIDLRPDSPIADQARTALEQLTTVGTPTASPSATH